jgi:putative transposase
MFSMSRFTELLQPLSKNVFHQSVEQNKSDRYAKNLKSWDLLMLMLYGQLNKTDSLRTLITGFNAQRSHHYHLNTRAARRSTVSDALAKRSPEPFKALCEALMKTVSRQQRKSCKDLLCIIDSTLITLKGPHYDHWTSDHRTPTTQGLKVHVAIDAQQNAPIYANITHANVNDLSDAKTMCIEPGMTYIVDKGYCDYNWWHAIESEKAKFITRLKYNAKHKVIGVHAATDEGSAILSDEVIQVTNKYPGGGRRNAYVEKDLRCIKVRREGNEKPLVVVTNDFDRSAQAIADLYRQRWQIELLFKWLKQKLKLKTYFGFSENATRIQIYSALIAYLLIILLKQNSAYKGSISELAIELKYNLFSRPTLDRYYYHKRKIRQQALNERQGRLWA